MYWNAFMYARLSTRHTVEQTETINEFSFEEQITLIYGFVPKNKNITKTTFILVLKN